MNGTILRSASKRLEPTPFYVFPELLEHQSLEELKKSKRTFRLARLYQDRQVGNFSELQQRHRILLLAEPGFGKSEFLKQYVCHLTEHCEKTLPLLIELKRYSPQAQETFETFVNKQARLQLRSSQSLSNLQQDYTLILLLDGLDEVHQSCLEHIVESLELLLMDCPQTRVIVTSRLHFYLRYPLLEERNFTYLQLDSFGDSEIQQYLGKRGIESEEARRLIKTFQESDLSSILSIPRYLEKYLELYKQGITKRLSKAEIYNHFVNARLEIEDKKYAGRGMKEIYRNFAEKLALVMEIHQENTVSRSELTILLDQLEGNLHPLIAAAGNFESLIEKQILVEYGDQISFEDRSLQEYLAACEMSKWGNQKKVYDLVVIEELNEINPSWVNTLSYYLDLDNSFFEYAIDFHPDLILQSNVEVLETNQKVRIFKKILTDWQEKKVWIDYQVALQIARLYSPELKPELERYIDESNHITQRSNIALLIGLVPLNEYKPWLVECAKDDNPGGVLQRRALHSLKKLGDPSVIELTKETLSHPDELVKEAFLAMCMEIDPEGAIDYACEAVKKNPKGRSLVKFSRWIAEITSSEALTKVLELLIEQPESLRRLSEDNLRGKEINQFFEHVEAVYSKAIQDLLYRLVLALLNVHKRNSTMMHQIAMLLKNKTPSIWRRITIQALHKENAEHLLFFLSTFLSYFITDKNLGEFIQLIKETKQYDWTAAQLVNEVQINQENPAASAIEKKARDLLPEYYQKRDEPQIHNPRLTYQQKQFLKWKLIFDNTPLQYQKSKLKLFYQCLDDFSETFELNQSEKRKVDTVIQSILKQIEPADFQIEVTEWADDGGVKTFTQSWEQSLYEKALKINFERDIGFADRKKLIDHLRVLHPGEHELLEGIFDALGDLEMGEAERIESFLEEDKSYIAIRTYIQVIKEKEIRGCLNLLKAFIYDPKVPHYEKTECLEVIEELSHDKDYLKSVFQDDSLNASIQERAAYLLISKHQDEKIFKWQIDKLKQGQHPDFWHGSESSEWLSRVKTPNAVELYIELLHTSYYNFPETAQKNTDWLLRIAIEGLKFQKNIKAVKALREFIDKHKEEKDSVHFLEFSYDEVQREYLLLKGKPSSIQAAVIRYNELYRKTQRKIPNELDLFNTIVEIFNKGIKHHIEEEQGYTSFYRYPPTTTKDKPKTKVKHEPEVQPLFLTWKPFFLAQGIRMARENETGRGPVDYTFNYGFKPRIQTCHCEIKLSNHKSLPDKFIPQLKTYIEADRADAAIFLVVRIANEAGPIPKDTTWQQWQATIQNQCYELGQQKGIHVKPIFINALKQPSASIAKE